MSANGKKTSIDAGLAAALAAGASIKEAAELMRCSERTVRRRWRDSAFLEEVNSLREEMTGSVIGRLASVGQKALAKVVALMDSAHEGIALKAAVAILDKMVSTRELVIDQKIREFNTQVAILQKKYPDLLDPPPPIKERPPKPTQEKP